jgi:hypothetical protein
MCSPRSHRKKNATNHFGGWRAITRIAPVRLRRVRAQGCARCVDIHTAGSAGVECDTRKIEPRRRCRSRLSLARSLPFRLVSLLIDAH